MKTLNGSQTSQLLNLGELQNEDQLRNLGKLQTSSELGGTVNDDGKLTPAQFGMRRSKLRKRPVSKPASDLDLMINQEKDTQTLK